jgi:acetyl esterase/lipase
MNHRIHVTRDIIFGGTGREDLTADVYLPGAGRDHPVVLLIHGGAWKAGSKEMYTDWGAFLADNGYAAISINYRLSTPTTATWPGVLDDVRQALHWLAGKVDDWKIDLDRVALIGDSCGAQLAALIALEGYRNASIRAVVGVYGVYDLAKWWEYTQRSRNDDPVGALFGAAPDEMPEAYKLASPLQRLEEEVRNPLPHTSFFLIWGDADEVVPPDQSEQFVVQLKRLGIKERSLAIPGQGHFWFTILPGKEGGALLDYPNSIIAPQLIAFLQTEL